jgi:hypothetical protein
MSNTERLVNAVTTGGKPDPVAIRELAAAMLSLVSRLADGRLRSVVEAEDIAAGLLADAFNAGAFAGPTAAAATIREQLVRAPHIATLAGEIDFEALIASGSEYTQTAIRITAAALQREADGAKQPAATGDDKAAALMPTPEEIRQACGGMEPLQAIALKYLMEQPEVSTRAAAKALGIPETNLRRWRAAWAERIPGIDRKQRSGENQQRHRERRELID